MKLRLQTEDIDLLTRCAPKGVKLDFGILQRHIGSGNWRCPDPIEPGIWSLECGDNVVYYYVEKILPPSSQADMNAIAYSVSLINPCDVTGCSAVTAAMALEKAQRLRIEWRIR